MDLAVKKKGTVYTISIAGKETDFLLLISKETEEGEWGLLCLDGGPEEDGAELLEGLKEIQKRFIAQEELADTIERFCNKKT